VLQVIIDQCRQGIARRHAGRIVGLCRGLRQGRGADQRALGDVWRTQTGEARGAEERRVSGRVRCPL